MMLFSLTPNKSTKFFFNETFMGPPWTKCQGVEWRHQNELTLRTSDMKSNLYGRDSEDHLEHEP